MNATYRLRHAIFHIRTVVIPRDRYLSRDNSPDIEILSHILYIFIVHILLSFWIVERAKNEQGIDLNSVSQLLSAVLLRCVHSLKIVISEFVFLFVFRFFIYSTKECICCRNTNKSFLPGGRHFPNDNW